MPFLSEDQLEKKGFTMKAEFGDGSRLPACDIMRRIDRITPGGFNLIENPA
jgi:hypothetical protein